MHSGKPPNTPFSNLCSQNAFVWKVVKLPYFISVTAWIKAWPPQADESISPSTSKEDLEHCVQFSPQWWLLRNTSSDLNLEFFSNVLYCVLLKINLNPAWVEFHLCPPVLSQSEEIIQTRFIRGVHPGFKANVVLFQRRHHMFNFQCSLSLLTIFFYSSCISKMLI